MSAQLMLLDPIVVKAAGSTKKAVRLGKSIGKMKMNAFLTELAFTKYVLIPEFLRLIDDEALEPSDSDVVEALWSHLQGEALKSSDTIVGIVAQYAPKLADAMYKAVDMSESLSSCKHHEHVGKAFGVQTAAEYMEDVYHCRKVLAEKFYALYESGGADTQAKRKVRAALLAISPWHLPTRLNAKEAFMHLVPEVVIDDLLESKFNRRRRGDTVRNRMKAEAKRAKRAAEAAQRAAAGESTPQESGGGRGPTWEKLGFRVSGDWSSTWKKPRSQQAGVSNFVRKPLPIVRPCEWVERPALRELRVDADGRCDYFLVREFEGRVFDLQYRAQAETGDDYLVESLSIEGGGDWNRMRVIGALRSAFADPALGLDVVFPPELVCLDRAGVTLDRCIA